MGYSLSPALEEILQPEPLEQLPPIPEGTTARLRPKKSWQDKYEEYEENLLPRTNPFYLLPDETSKANRAADRDLTSIALHLQALKSEPGFLAAADVQLTHVERTLMANDRIDQEDILRAFKLNYEVDFKKEAVNIASDTTGNAERINIHKSALVIGHTLSLIKTYRRLHIAKIAKLQTQSAKEAATVRMENRLERLQQQVLNTFQTHDLNILMVNPRNREGTNMTWNLERNDIAKRMSAVHKLRQIESGNSNEKLDKVNTNFYKQAAMLCHGLMKELSHAAINMNQDIEEVNEEVILNLKALYRKAVILEELYQQSLEKKKEIIIEGLDG